MTQPKSYITQFVTLLSGNTLSQAIPFLFAPILARLFTDEDFAVLANYLSIVGLLGIIATGRLETAIPLPKEKSEAQQLVSGSLVFTVIVTLLSCLLIVFKDEIGNWYNDKSLGELMWFAPLGVLSYGILGITNGWSLRNQRYRSISAGKIAQSLVNNLGSCALGYWAWGVPGMIVAWLLSQYLNSAVLLFGITTRSQDPRDKFTARIFRSIVSKYRDFPLINSLHAFTDIFATQFLLFYIITVYFSEKELGLFFMMHRYVRAPIVLITSSVSQLYYVEASKAIQNNTSALAIATKTLKTAALFAIPFCIVLVIGAPVLFSWYLGPSWRQAGEYAQILAPMFLLYFFVSPLSGTPILYKKQRTAFVISVLGYVISIGGLVVGLAMGWDFRHALILYTAGYVVFYSGLLFWYFRLIRGKK